VGDIGGFRHDDLFKAPPAGAYANPPCNGTSGLAFAAKLPNVIVRAGRTWNGEEHGAISKDGGQTWEPFATEPKVAETGGMVAITSDGKTIVGTVKGAPPSVSRDGGKTWKPVAGIRDSIKLPDWSPIDLQPQADAEGVRTRVPGHVEPRHPRGRTEVANVVWPPGRPNDSPVQARWCMRANWPGGSPMTLRNTREK
jgi:hypothetical protein